MLNFHQRKKRLVHRKRRSLRDDPIGRKATESLAIASRTYTTTSEYNSRGELTKVTYPDSSISERTYHDTGALHLLKLDGSTISTRTYDDGRRLTGETLGNGVTETRTYSTDNLLTGISYGGTGTAIGNLSYTWDANKNKTSETIGGTMSGYGFTSAGTSYDDEDSLTGYARASGTFTQAWNLTPVGDWNSITTNGTAQNRTHGPTHELLTAAGQNITTDVKGNITVLPANLTPQSSPLALQWDFDNKLKAADLGNNSSVDVNFQYDALGRRVARLGSSGSFVFVQHDQQTIADYGYGDAPSSPLYRYVYASYIDEPVVRKAAGTGGTIHYYHRNQQYSITAMTTSTGAVAERYAYTAYGQPTILNASGTVLTSSVVGNRYTYTGREWDETLGLHHFRARWMSPLAGRFLGRDPIGYAGSDFGLYEYVNSRSLVNYDPSGLIPITCVCQGYSPRDQGGGPYRVNRNVDCGGLATTCCPRACGEYRWDGEWWIVPQLPQDVDLCAGDWENSGFANCWSCCVKKYFNPLIGLPAAGAAGCCMFRIEKGQSLSGIYTKSLGTCCGEWITNCRRALFPNAPGNPWPMRICRGLGKGGGIIFVGGCSITIESACAAYCGA